MKSGDIVRACAHRLNFHQGLLVPEAVVDCSAKNANGYGFGQKRYQADLMWVTRDRYATEIEVKVSRSDWRVDSAKRKWEYLPGWVTRFIYAVPEELGIPDFVMPQAGIWHITPCAYWGLKVKTVRAPKRIGKDKVPDWLAERWMAHLHSRYWYQHLHGKRAPSLKAA